MPTLADSLLAATESGPLNPRRRLLSEAEYTLPSTGDRAMFDLYCLYALSWQEGSGKEDYGYEPTSFLHSRKLRIDRTFEECLVKYADRLLIEAKRAIADEADNVFDRHLVNPREVVAWGVETKRLQALKDVHDGTKTWLGALGYFGLIELFKQPFWRSERSDLFGGEPWVKIVDAIRELDDRNRRGSLVELMGAVDRLLDLEHNTGALASKLTTLAVSMAALDQRAELRTPEAFAEFVSGPVRKLLRTEP